MMKNQGGSRHEHDVILTIFSKAWNKLKFKVGISIVLLMFTLSLIGPFIVPFPHEGYGYVPENAFQRTLKPPSYPFIFGTDTRGRDLFSRVVLGARSAFLQVFTVISISLVIGLFAGILAAYLKGVVEVLINYLIELFMGLPAIIMALALRLTMGQGIVVVIVSLILTWWSWYARITYVYARAITEMEYVVLARLSGVNPFKIITRHVLRNAFPPVFVQSITDVGSVLLEASAINFLGLGMPLDSPEWGVIMYEGIRFIERAPWISLFPGLFLLISAIGFGLVGDCLREEIDPRLRRKWRLWF
ncbi:MAG: ABC transporter permease [Desulfurococcaceae archaeon]